MYSRAGKLEFLHLRIYTKSRVRKNSGSTWQFKRCSSVQAYYSQDFIGYDDYLIKDHLGSTLIGNDYFFLISLMPHFFALLIRLPLIQTQRATKQELLIQNQLHQLALLIT